MDRRTLTGSPVRRWLERALLVAGSVVLGLLLSELALRLFVPTDSPLTFDLFRRLPDGQLRLQPNARRQHIHPAWNVAVALNGDGFRDLDRPPAAGQQVIIGLGDSFAFGWGVEYEESYLARLGAALGGPNGGPRVMNAGIPGTGPSDQLPLLDTLLARRHADVVLLGFFVGNDFSDVVEGGAAQFDVVDGLLARRGGGTSWPQRARAWVKRRSHLGQLLARQVWAWEQRRALAGHPQPLDTSGGSLRESVQIFLREPLPQTLARGVADTLEQLGEMRRRTAAQGGRFVLLAIPRSIQIYESDRRRFEATLGIDPAQWDLNRPQRILREWAASNGVTLIDPRPALARAAAEAGGRLYYYPDAHLTAAGHRIIAEELTVYFRNSASDSLPTMSEAPSEATDRRPALKARNP